MKVYISQKSNKLIHFGNIKAHLMCKFYLAHDFWKKWYHKVQLSLKCIRGTKSLNNAQKNCATKCLILSALKLNSCGPMVFIDMNAYILAEDRNFKTFLKKDYAVALNCCYMSTKKMLNMELNIMLMLLLKFVYIRHSWTLQQFHVI